ncbi:nuclear transport factor 2 family protein [Halorubrum sp. F4]|uniref:nuclear transport factor 2 family protein n=1 Tax=Halorubrum sp. F4 TaxID=2989715 RepID=UPI002480004C|nr:nuclear transport factor 2 family protein [Halorubrum sp. F4]
MSRAIRTARAYYEAIDDADYDRLADLLDPEFVHERPDRTLEGRDRFVEFMREERPRFDTEHVVDALYESDRGVAVRGRLLAADGEELFAFVDVFTVEGGRLAGLKTYVRTDG